MFTSIANTLLHFFRSFSISLSPAFQLLQAFYLQKRFLVPVQYAKQPVIVRGGTSDVNVFYEIFALQIYKIPKIEIEAVVDLGANVGYASIYFAHFCPQARIIAVEPEHSNYELLVENTQAIKNIHCIHAAIWPQETQVTLQNPGGSNWGFQYHEAVADFTGPVVRTETLPGLMKKFGLNRINLLKIDIEGGEENLFSSDTEWLRCVDYLHIEIHSDQAKKVVFQALASYPHTYVHDGFNNYRFSLKHPSS